MALNEYRVHGTFSYTPFDGADEEFKTITVRQDARSSEEAVRLVIADCKHEYGEDACWLISHPTVEYHCSVLERETQLSAYWTQGAKKQAVIRQRVWQAGKEGK